MAFIAAALQLYQVPILGERSCRSTNLTEPMREEEKNQEPGSAAKMEFPISRI